MARWNLLSARKVDGLKRDGVYADGSGLYLRVRGNARYWIFIYHLQGKRREMSLGALPGVTLARGREKAQGAREVLARGSDPLRERDVTVLAIPSFGNVADDWIKDRASTVRSAKSVARWSRLLGEGGPAGPLRATPVNEVTTQHIVDALIRTWSKTPSHVMARNYIEAVLDKAKALGHRGGDNPARWDGHLEHLMPEKPKAGGHHAALPSGELPDFLARLRARPAMAARALEFTILTAARSGEALGSRWSEIDLQQRVWIVPAERMKAGRQHRVPLTDAALAILQPLAELREGDFVFPGQQRGQPLSGMAMEMMLRRMDMKVTVHGFRSTFKDWATDHTSFIDQLSEHALAHVVGDASRRAYARSDMLEKRRGLMDAWSAFCGSQGGSDATPALDQPATPAPDAPTPPV